MGFQPEGSDLLKRKLDVLDWLKNSNVVSPFGSLSSAYAHTNRGAGESLPFTNVTDDFVDTLDYVWYDAAKLEVEELLWVPKSFSLLNELEISNGHVVPSDVFPSDHLAIGARFCVRSNIAAEETKDISSSPHRVTRDSGASPADVVSMMTFASKAHNPRCACGCVPALPSLFEMAELRKQARARKQAESK